MDNVNKEITCSVDSVTELLRAIKDLPDTKMVSRGTLRFKVGEYIYDLEQNQILDDLTIPEFIIAVKVGRIDRLVFGFTHGFTWYTIYTEEDGEDMDLLDLFEA